MKVIEGTMEQKRIKTYISITISCSLKNCEGLHELAGQLPVGVPSVVTSTLWLDPERDEGMLAREKNQILIPVSANSVTHIPPPAAANGAP
jgi:hypothetical protein